jgi:hypothetical protein
LTYSDLFVNILLSTGNPTFTKSFHIPGLRLPPTVKAETHVSTSAAPKMKVYLPPPINFVNVKRPTLNKSSGYSNRIGLSSMKETEDRKHLSSPTSLTDAYPSPSRSSSKLSLSQAKSGARNYFPSPPRSLPGVRRVVVGPYRPPSPPTSDFPIPSSDADDIYVEVDHEGIQLRYADVKRLSRKVLCLIFFRFCSIFEVRRLLTFCVLVSSANARVLMYGI